jgi:ElaB/YqjD/DUF883 family membrane-anchored ribosome-binding protein
MAKEFEDKIASAKEAAQSTVENVSASATDAAREARERFGRISGDLQDRYRRVSEDVRRGAERAQSELRRGADTARERYESTSAGLRESYAKARTGADDLTRQVSDYVRENPGKSVLMAAGVGFLLGLVFRGRGDEEDYE